MSIVEAKKLSFDYIRRDEDGNVEAIVNAVQDVTMQVEAGEFVAILGHNGSGKSTLSKHFNSLLLPTEGTVFVTGIDTTDEEKLWEIRQTVGMVFQNPDNQIIASTVEEDVAFGPENMGIPTGKIVERVDFALKAVGMEEYRMISPNRLSGGQKQRISIAGIVAMQPKCIVLDEATAMLDPNGRKEVMSILHEINQKNGITIILITHYMDEVVDADRVFVMDGGRIVMTGTPKQIFSEVEQLRQLRLDVPQVTQVAHELRRHGLPLESGILTINELVDAICQLS